MNLQIPAGSFVTVAMLIEPATAEQLAAIRVSTGITEEQIKDGVKEIKKWLEEQPHLPNDHGKY
jgi:3-polyprenyl-4-hydroxybenzoate decarboxylase